MNWLFLCKCTVDKQVLAGNYSRNIRAKEDFVIISYVSKITCAYIIIWVQRIQKKNYGMWLSKATVDTKTIFDFTVKQKYSNCAGWIIRARGRAKQFLAWTLEVVPCLDTSLDVLDGKIHTSRNITSLMCIISNTTPLYSLVFNILLEF